MIREAEDFKKLLTEHFVIDDLQAIDIVLAAVVSHKVPGEMLWLRIIGASGSGKTELARTLIGQDGYTETMEHVTPAAIRRGFAIGNKHMSTLLERLDNKLVITKESAPLFTTNRDSKMEVFGLLRSVWDGCLDADYGSNQGHLQQKVRFDWIMNATQYIDRQNQLEIQLGSRFLDLRWGPPMDRAAAVRRAIGNDGHLTKIRACLAESMRLIIDAATVPDSPPCVDGYLIDIANAVAALRTPVERDSRSKDVIEVPTPELGTRIGQGFARLVKGFEMLGAENWRPYIRRLALDCLPTLRAAILRAKSNGCRTQEEIAITIGISQTTVNHVLEDLRLLNSKDYSQALLENGWKPELLFHQ